MGVLYMAKSALLAAPCFFEEVCEVFCEVWGVCSFCRIYCMHVFFYHKRGNGNCAIHIVDMLFFLRMVCYI